MIEGVIRTRVGYAGGRAEAPSYRSMGDHTETVQVDFDPDRISYEELLKIFWESHDPESSVRSAQYKNAVFYHNAEQARAAEASKAALETHSGRAVQTEILPLRQFTMAEDYHQKYLLKNHRLKAEILRIYPNHGDLVNSTAAARLNGYAGGYGSKAQMDREIGLLGLSRAGQDLLRETVGN